MANDGEQLGLATEVTVAWLSNAHTRARAEDVTAMLGSVLSALRRLGEPTSESAAAPGAPVAPEHTRAVTKRRSLASPEHIVSMIDGKPYRSLTRHLKTHGLTPDQYRARYGLKPDYPMVAPGYSAERSAAAKEHNFGRLAQPAREPEPAASPSKPMQARKSVTEAKQAAQAHLGTSD